MILSVAHNDGTLSASYWKQERFIILYTGNITNEQVSIWSNAQGTISAPIAKYYTDTNKQVYIDVTDFLRAYSNATIIYLSPATSSQKTINVTRAGLINPDNVLIPPHWAYAKIVPPDYMIGDTSAQQIKAEFYNYADASYSTSGATWATNHRYLVINSATFDLYRSASPTSYRKTYNMHARQCDRQYALVEWVSFSGVTRRHVFEVVKNTTKTANAYSLLPTDNEYIEIKGRNDGFTLRLDNLNAYDLWYYSDILHSSNVKVNFDCDNPNSADFERVQVADNKITIPDGNAGIDGVLEINVNWKHYDAVAL